MSEHLLPTMQRWELGSVLRQIRERQNKTIDQVAQDLSELYGTGFSAAKIGRLETGKRGANPRDVRDLCDYYEITASERDRLVSLAKDVRQDNRLSGASSAAAEFFALESVAVAERNYEPMFIPGLLQTADYYRAMIDSYALAGRSPASTDESSRTKIEIRRQRQLRLGGDNAIRLHAIIDENVVRRRAGSDQVMAEQLAHLITMSHQPNITLRVVPLAAGLYPGCESSGFALLEYDENGPGSENTCLIQGIVSAVWAEHAADRLHIAAMFEFLERISLSPNKSRELVNSVISDLII